MAFSIDKNKNIFPYAVKNYVYNFDSDLSFIIIMLNTSRMYRYEYITLGNSKLFTVNDNCVKAILSMYKKFDITIVDDSLYKSCLYQFVNNSVTILVAEKSIPNKNNCFLWHSIYSNVISDIPKINSETLEKSLPTLEDLKDLIKNITAYHYISKNKKEKILYGVWSEDIYFPCAATIQFNIPILPNKPYLLIPRNRDGSIYTLPSDISNFILF